MSIRSLRGLIGLIVMVAAASFGGCATDHDANIRAGSAATSAERTVAAADSADEADAAADAQTRDAGCAWGVDALLREVELSLPERRNCGSYSADLSPLPGAFACFDAARSDGAAVELTVNQCDDCLIPRTYLATASGELLLAFLEDDLFGDDQRVASLSRCDAIALDPARQRVSCTGETELYACSEPRALPREPLSYPPVQPFKLADVPVQPPQESTVLHLYVSNQSFADALIPLRVYVDEVQVVIGDFAVEDQHNWLLFDIEVPVGARTLRASSFSGRNSASLTQQIDLPGERWAVLNYWYAPNDPESAHFRLRVSEQPPAFK